ncbi:bacteriohemerythrin [Azotosporobacter soli]|uniref:bacteriohemerythrin n=1 Tax=Azotosporobacter soli TaxID=3055040 RepID=UPI0031FF2F34
MALLCWDESYSVRIKELDRQHRKIVEGINRLHDSLKLGGGKEETVLLLTELRTHMQEHFQTEEGYLKANDYADFSDHCEQHQFFLHRLNELEERLKKRRSVKSALTLVQQLNQQQVEHVREHDQSYTKRLVEKGVL